MPILIGSSVIKELYALSPGERFACHDASEGRLRLSTAEPR
jgi:hypothetical protein